MSKLNTLKTNIGKFFTNLFTSKFYVIRRNELLEDIIKHYTSAAKSDDKLRSLDKDIIENMQLIIKGLEEMDKQNEKINKLSKIIIDNNKKTISKQERTIEELNIINWDNLKEIEDLKLELLRKEKLNEK